MTAAPRHPFPSPTRRGKTARWWVAGATRDSDAYEVFVDGVHPFLCVAADAGEGWADCYRLDGWGNVEQDGLTGRPKLDRIEGRVEIRPVRDEAWSWH